VVLLHPAGATSEIWWKVTSLLPNDLRVHGFDLPGRPGDQAAAPEGRTGPPTFEEEADHLASWMASAGLDRAVLAGISMGGMLAQYTAARHPSIVAGLVIGNTNHRQTPEGRAALLRRAHRCAYGDLTDDYLDETIERWFTPGFHRRHSGDVDRVRRIMRRVPAAEHSADWSRIAGLDTTALLPAIGCPTTVIAASHDTSTSAAVQREIADLLPQSSLVVTDDAAHMSCVEEPVIWADAITRHLRDDTDAGPTPHP
jgi:3-oxoadipate enol-lactonase